MDSLRFDALARALSAPDSRRRVLGLLTAVPVVGGLLGLLSLEETEAGGRRKRRKTRNKRRSGSDKKHRKGKHHKKKPCTPDAVTQTCAGKCGSVQNNCQQYVNCGSCDCDPACEPCFLCQGAAGAPGTCIPQETGTPCGDATICESGTLLPQGSCNGSGTCEPGTPVPCVPYTQCAGNACATSCSTDTDCVAGSFCNGERQCVGDLPNGESCTHGGQCTSGFCPDGVCCNSACDATCQACNVSGSVGTCTVEPDLSTCGGGNVCCSGSCQTCCSSAQCATPTMPLCRSGSCVACTANPADCPSGTCCASDGSCQVGTTNAACGTSGTCAVCTAPQTCGGGGTARECGCGAVGGPCCASGAACLNGGTCCNGQCVDTATDARNCGACGNGCVVNGTCAAGACLCAGRPVRGDGSCCLNSSQPGQSCANPTFFLADTCAQVTECPPGYTPCVGYACRACCPAGTTCDTTITATTDGGFCRQ